MNLFRGPSRKHLWSNVRCQELRKEPAIPNSMGFFWVLMTMLGLAGLGCCGWVHPHPMAVPRFSLCRWISRDSVNYFLMTSVLTQKPSARYNRRKLNRFRLCSHAWRLLGVGLVLGGLLVASSPSPSEAVVTYSWPLRTERKIVGAFDNPPENWLPGHRGIDIATANGRTVYAPGPGTVTFAGDLAGRGVISITHGWFRTTYEPVTPSVVVGQYVKKDQAIGRISPGVSHCGSSTTGYCLHWGMRTDYHYFNPLILISAKGKLIPIGGTS